MVKLCSAFKGCQTVAYYNARRAIDNCSPQKLDTVDNSSNICNVNGSQLLGYGSDPVEGAVTVVSHLFWLEFLSVCVFGNLILFVGLIGNIFNIVILSRTGIGRDATNILLLFLAVTDVVVLVTHFGQFSTCFTCYLDRADAISVDTYFLMFGSFYSMVATFLSVDITAMIALERAVAVFFPFRVARIFSKTTVKAFVAIMLVLLIPLCVYRHLALKIVWSFYPRFNRLVARTYRIVGNPKLFSLLVKYIENVNLFGGMSIVLICGSAITFKMITQSRNRKLMTTSGTSTKDRKVVKMLLTVCFFSFFGNIPNISSNFLNAYYQGDADLYCFVRGMILISIVINSSVNFFIYISMSSKFQKAYKDLFRESWVAKLLKNKSEKEEQRS